MGYTYDAHVYANASHIQQYGDWGIAHETGHNHQWDSWTHSATDETGCNWWSLYVNQNVKK